MTLYNAVHSKGEVLILKKIAVVMWNTTYYHDLLNDFSTKKVFTQQYMPQISQCLKKLEPTSDEEVPTFSELSEAVNVYANFASKAREGLGPHFLTALQPRLEAAMVLFNEKLMKTAPGEHEADLKAALSLFRLVAKTIPNSVCNVAKEMSTATQMVQHLEHAAAAQALTDKFNVITTEWIEMATAEDLQVYIGISAGIDQKNFPKQEMRPVVSVLLAAVTKEPWGSDKGLACVDICVEMKGMVCCSVDEDQQHAIGVLVACKGLVARVKAWKDLGSSLEARVGNDKGNQALRSAAAAMKELEQALASTKMGFPVVEVQRKSAAMALQTGQDMILASSQKDVQAKLATMHLAMGGVIGPDKNWKDDLSSKPTFASFVKTAQKSLLLLQPKEGKITDIVELLVKSSTHHQALAETYDANYPRI